MADEATIIACDAEIAAMCRSHLPGLAFPDWNAADPMAKLRQDGAHVNVLLSYGGFEGNDRIIEALPRLGLVQVLGAGYDGLDPIALRDRGTLLANTGDLNSGFVADHVMALALGIGRRVVDADRWVRSGRWGRGQFPTLPAFSLRRAGIVGLGNIGRCVARRLAGFDIPVSWWGPREKPDEPLPRAESLLALAHDSDLLVVACPGGPESHGLVNAAVIDAVGPRGMIVSVARGSVTDENALIAALKEGRLGAAGLDVFESEPTPSARWADVPNVLLSPHHAGLVSELGSLIAPRVSENIRRFLAGEAIANRIMR